MLKLSSAQRPLSVVGRQGRKKKRARGTMGRGKGFRLFPLPFFYFYKDTQREPLRRREVLKYVAFEKRLKEGGKKSGRGGGARNTR